MILFLLACSDIEDPQVLPVQLSLMLRVQDGSIRSLLVELGRTYEHQLDVREASGPLLYDGRHLWEWTETIFQDRLGKRTVTLPAQGELRGVDRSSLWLQAPEGLLHCSMGGFPLWSGIPSAAPEVRCSPATGGVDLRMNHPGPGVGFGVSLQKGTVYLRLPADQQTQGQAIRQEVSEILGIRWVRVSRASRRLEKYYRGQASFTAQKHRVEVDGQLSEWGEGMGPLVVQRSWQVERGSESWSGPRDASFSVAVVQDEGRLCLAGRLRDDQRDVGDALLLELEGEHWELPLGGLVEADHVYITTSELELAMGRDWYGAHYEACLPSPPRTSRSSFSLSFLDEDGGQATLLSTAPPDSAAGVLHLSPGT